MRDAHHGATDATLAKPAVGRVEEARGFVGGLVATAGITHHEFLMRRGSRLPEDKSDALIERTPLGCIAVPRGIAADVASPAASYATGAVIPVAGGAGVGL